MAKMVALFTSNETLTKWVKMIWIDLNVFNGLVEDIRPPRHDVFFHRETKNASSQLDGEASVRCRCNSSSKGHMKLHSLNACACPLQKHYYWEMF